MHEFDGMRWYGIWDKESWNSLARATGHSCLPLSLLLKESCCSLTRLKSTLRWILLQYHHRLAILPVFQGIVHWIFRSLQRKSNRACLAKAYLVKTVFEKKTYSPLGSLRFLDENAEIYTLSWRRLPWRTPCHLLSIVFPSKATNF